MSTTRALRCDPQLDTSVNVSDQTIRSRFHDDTPSAQRPLVDAVLTAWRPGARTELAGESAVNVTLPATFCSMIGLVVGQYWSGEANSWRDTQIDVGTLTGGSGSLGSSDRSMEESIPQTGSWACLI